MCLINLKSFWLAITKDKFLLLILLLGLILKTTNPTFGSPSLYISNDEAIAHLSAWNMLAQKTPVSIANYTPLGAYVQIPFLVISFLAMKFLGLVTNAHDFELFVLTHEGYFLFIPRIISGFFGTMIILVVYKICRLLFEEKQAALIGAFLTAVSFNLVHISHFGKPWAVALFFFVLATYLALKQKSMLSYLTVGLSYGFHQVGILAIPLALLISKRLFAIKNLLGVMIMAISIGIFSFLTLKVGIIKAIEQGQSFLKPGTIISDFLTGNQNYLESLLGTIANNFSAYFIVNFLVSDGVILFFAIWGIFKTFNQGRNKKVLVLYLLFYFLFASLFFHPLLRYLLPLILILIPFAAYGIYDVFLRFRLKYQKYIGWILTIIILTLASINSLWWNWLYIKTPTFIQAHNWINKNIPTDVPIAYIGGRYQTFTPNKVAIKHMQTINSNLYLRLSMNLPDGNLDNVRNIIYVSKFTGNNILEQFKNATVNYPVQYVVDYYLDPTERLYNFEPSVFKLRAHFNPIRSNKSEGLPEPLFDATWNFPTNDLRPKVSMYSMERTGPYIDILEIKN